MNTFCKNQSQLSSPGNIVVLTMCALIMLPTLWQTNSLQAASQDSARDAYAIAAGHYSRGNWDDSVNAFESVLRNYPDSNEAIDATFFLAEVMMQRQEFGPAYNAYQLFMQKYPNHEFTQRATFRLGESAFRLKKYDISLRLLEEFVRLNPHDGLTEFALPYLGEMRLNRDEPQLAQRAFETALRIYPSGNLSNSCRLGLAKSLQRLGNDDEATRFYNFLKSKGTPAMVGESHLQLGIMSFGRVDFEKAEKQLTVATMLCESEAAKSEAVYWLARTFNAVEDHARAVELLETVETDQLPEKLAAAILFDGAVAATKIKKHDQALVWLSELRAKYPTSTHADEAMKLEINVLQVTGNRKETANLIKSFRNANKTGALLTDVMEAEGRTHYAERNYVETISTFETLLSENEKTNAATPSEIANWHYFKSLGHLGLAEFKNAETTLDQINALPQSKQLKPLVRIAKATAQFGQEKYQSAAANYREYLTLAPKGDDTKRARAELTICLAETQEWKKASLAFDDLEMNHAEDPLVLGMAIYLAEKSYREKQNTYAERWFTFMANSNGDEDTVARGLSGLAWLKIDSRDIAGAYTVFESLLEKCPDSKFAGEAALARAKYLEDELQYLEASQMYGLVVRRFANTPMASVAMLRRAYSLQKVGGEFNLKEARTLLLEYVALPANNPLADEALYQIGWLHRDLGEDAKSSDAFAQLVEKFSRSKYWSDAAYRLAKTHVTNKNYKSASELVERLLKRDDAPVEVVSRALFLQGEIASAQNQWANVTSAMEGLIGRTKDDSIRFKAKYWLSESLYRQKQYEKASEEFEQLIPECDRFDKKLKPWIALRNSQCLGYQNDWANAAALANDAKQEFLGFEADYEFDFILGRSLEDSGKLTDARKHYQSVVDSARGGSTETAAIAQWRIGETFFHQENFVAAIKAYHKVDALFAYAHWRSAALMQAGKCQENLRNNKHAIKLYTQLIESFPTSQFVTDARTRLNRLTEQAKLTGESNADSSKSRR
ncbi:MAG: tol-pal system YbgF family protein [Mariniblastus sp.]